MNIAFDEAKYQEAKNKKKKPGLKRTKKPSKKLIKKALKAAFKTAPEPQEPPNPFQVQRMYIGDYNFITFNYHPFLNKSEAMDLAIQLIYHSSGGEYPLLRTAKRRLKELGAWLAPNLEGED